MPATTALRADLPAAEPRPLARCTYPTAAEVARHGLQRLPDVLPVVDFARVAAHRSAAHHLLPFERLSHAAILAAARVVASAFARREPQCRHLRPAALPPLALAGATHRDDLGSEPFGDWTMTTILFWFVRLLVLTDPASPRGAIRTSAGALRQSLALVADDGTILGAAINETLLPHDATEPPRTDDPFLAAVLHTVEPVLTLLGEQDAAAVAALSAHDPGFARALARGQVGHHFMVARADALPTAHAFELVAGTAARYHALGFHHVIVEATNQWTGAACEALGGTRVHFAPFRAAPAVIASDSACDGAVSSPDGYLAAKDSGSMLYVLRLR